jgi:vacuolar-type H+-ATPase subunit F/Vma7
MSEAMKVAIVGDAGPLFGFRALGVEVFAPADVDEARAVLERLEREGYGLCLLHERFFGPLKEEREALGRRFSPVVVGFSDYRTASDHLEVMLREMSVRATGTDALVKRKG